MFPTPVGMNRARAILAFSPFYIPHTRGDEPNRVSAWPVSMICSPHPWG